MSIPVTPIFLVILIEPVPQVNQEQAGRQAQKFNATQRVPTSQDVLVSKSSLGFDYQITSGFVPTNALNWWKLNLTITMD